MTGKTMHQSPIPPLPERCAAGHAPEISPAPRPTPAQDMGQEPAFAERAGRTIALVAITLGTAGALVPLAQAVIDVIQVAQSDLGRFTIDDVAGFATSAGDTGDGPPR